MAGRSLMSAYVAILADVKTLKKDLRIVENEVRSSSHKMESSFSGVNKSLNNMAMILKSGGTLYGLREITVSVFNLGKAFVDTSARFERLELKMDVVTKGKGPQAMSALLGWVEKIPVSVDAAAESFVSMQARSLDPTIRKMSILADTASVLGDDVLKRVSKALGDMASYGKLSAEELNQLSEVGINAKKYLTEAFGGATVKQIQSSGVAIQEVIDIIWKGMEVDFKGAAERFSKTWDGTMASVKKHLELLKKSTMDTGGAFDSIKEALQEFDEWLVDNKDSILEWTERMAEASLRIGRFIGDVGELIGLLSKLSGLTTFVDLTSSIPEKTSLITEFAGAKASAAIRMGGVGKIDEFLELIKENPAVATLAANVARVSQALDDATRAKENYAKQPFYLRTDSESNALLEDVQNLTEELGEAEKAVEKMAAATRKFVKGMSEEFPTVTNDAVEFYQDLTNKIMTAENQLKKFKGVAKDFRSEFKDRKGLNFFEQDTKSASLMKAIDANAEYYKNLEKARLKDYRAAEALDKRLAEERVRNQEYDLDQALKKISELEAEYMEVMDSIESASVPVIRDFFDGFDKGFKSLEKTIVDTFKDAFAKILYEEFVEKIAKQAVGAFGITPSSGVAGGAGLLGTLGAQKIDIPIPWATPQSTMAGPTLEAAKTSTFSITGAEALAGATFGLAAVNAFKSDEQGAKLGLAAGTALGAAFGGPLGAAIGASIGSEIGKTVELRMELPKSFKDFALSIGTFGLSTLKFGGGGKTRDIDQYLAFGSPQISARPSEIQARAGGFAYSSIGKDYNSEVAGRAVNIAITDYFDGVFSSIENQFGISIKDVTSGEAKTFHLDNVEKILNESGIDGLIKAFTGEFFTSYGNELADAMKNSPAMAMINPDKQTGLLEKVRAGGFLEVADILGQVGDVIDGIVEMRSGDLSNALRGIDKDFDSLTETAKKLGIVDSELAKIEDGRLQAKQKAIMGDSPFSFPDINSILSEMGDKGLEGGITKLDEQAAGYLFFLDKFNAAMALGLTDDADKIKLAFDYWLKGTKDGTNQVVDAVTDAANRWQTAMSEFYGMQAELSGKQQTAMDVASEALKSFAETDLGEVEGVKAKWQTLIDSLKSTALEAAKLQGADSVTPFVQNLLDRLGTAMATEIENVTARIASEAASTRYAKLEQTFNDIQYFKAPYQLKIDQAEMTQEEKLLDDYVRKANEYNDKFGMSQKILNLLIDAYLIDLGKLSDATKKTTESLNKANENAMASTMSFLATHGMSPEENARYDIGEKYKGIWESLAGVVEGGKEWNLLVKAGTIEMQNWLDAQKEAIISFMEPFETKVVQIGMTDLEKNIYNINSAYRKSYEELIALGGGIDEINTMIIALEEDRRLARREAAMSDLDDAVEAEKNRLTEAHNVAVDTMTDRIDAVSEALEEYKKAFSDAESTLNRSFDARRNEIEKDLADSLEKTNMEVVKLKDSSGVLKSAFDAISGARQSRMVSGGEEASYQRTIRQLDDVLSAVSSGDFTGLGDFTKNIGSLTQDTTKFYTNRLDYERDFYKTALKLKSLEELTKGQLTEAEQQIQLLETGNEDARREAEELIVKLDELKNATLGIDTSILTITDAIASYNAASAMVSDAVLEALKESLESENTDFELAMKTLDETRESAVDVGKSILTVADAVAALAATNIGVKTAVEAVGVSNDGVSDSVGKVGGATLEVSGSVSDVGISNDGVSDSVGKVGISNASIAGTLTRMMVSNDAIYGGIADLVNSINSMTPSTGGLAQFSADDYNTYEYLTLQGLLVIKNNLNSLIGGTNFHLFNLKNTSVGILNSIQSHTRMMAGALGVEAPAFAAGGYHDGGLRIVGENGPEIEDTMPSRIYSNSQTKRMLDNSEVVSELKALRIEIQQSKADTKRAERLSLRYLEMLERWEQLGMPVERAA